jgi:sarcosine oxidase subunit gamma
MSDISGFTITEPPPRSIAGIASYRDQAALRAALQIELGLMPPATPAFVAASGISLSCLSPTRYLATADRPADLPARLATLSNLAAITDQSDLWHVFIISGPSATEALSRLVPIDLSADKFPTGSLALTRAGHLDVRLWHIAAQTYEIAVSRSYAEDLRHDLMSLAKQ